MCRKPSRRSYPGAGQQGIALITAIFAIVILALFGLLIARYTVTSQTSSAEDYLWAQALYSAESVVRLNILSRDNGGNLGKATVKPSNIQGFDFTPTGMVSGDFETKAENEPATIRVQAVHTTGVSRTVEAKYLLASP